MPSKVPALLAYLVAEFTNAVTLGAATPAVAVYDGPPTTALDAPLKLYVGLTDPDSDAAEEAAVVTQARPDLGGAQRDETISVRCCAEAWAGTDDMPTVRAQVFAITAAVETLVRGDTMFGGLPGTTLAAPGFNSGSLLQNNTQTGAIARVPFTIDFRSIS